MFRYSQSHETVLTESIALWRAEATMTVPGLHQVFIARRHAHVGGVEELKVLHVARLARSRKRARRHFTLYSATSVQVNTTIRFVFTTTQRCMLMLIQYMKQVAQVSAFYLVIGYQLKTRYLQIMM